MERKVMPVTEVDYSPTVDQVIAHLQAISDGGCGDWPVVVTTEDGGVPMPLMGVGTCGIEDGEVARDGQGLVEIVEMQMIPEGFWGDFPSDVEE